MKKFIFLLSLFLTIACTAQNVSYKVRGDSLFVRYRVVDGSYVQTKISPVTAGGSVGNADSLGGVPASEYALNDSIQTWAETDSLINEKISYITVESFGALPDGITDNSTALQSAINYALDNKRGLAFRSGTYNFNTGLLIDKWGLVVKGEGKENTILQYTGTGNAITIGVGTDYLNTTAYTSIYDLTIKGQAGTQNGILLQNACEVFMSNCNVLNFGYNGLTQGVDTWTNTFVKCSFVGNDSAGVDAKLNFNLTGFYGCSFRENNIGFNVSNPTSLVRTIGFYDCSFEANDSSGIVLKSYGSNWEIRNCWFEANGEADIVGNTFATSSITNCNFDTPHPNSIIFDNVTYGSTIERNVGYAATDAFIKVINYIDNSIIQYNRSDFYNGGAHLLNYAGAYYDQDIYNATSTYNDFLHGARMNGIELMTKTGFGKIGIYSGDSTFSGSLEFNTPAGVRTGYFGYTNNPLTLPLNLGTGVTFNVLGGNGLEVDTNARIGNDLAVVGNITSPTIDKLQYISIPFYLSNPATNDSIAFKYIDQKLSIDSIVVATADSSITMNLLICDKAYNDAGTPIFAANKVIASDSIEVFYPITTTLESGKWLRSLIVSTDGDVNERLSIQINAHRVYYGANLIPDSASNFNQGGVTYWFSPLGDLTWNADRTMTYTVTTGGYGHYIQKNGILTIGRTYRLSFRVKVDNVGGVVGLAGVSFGGSWQYATTYTTGEYTTYTFTGVCSDTQNLFLTCARNDVPIVGDTFTIDDIILEEL